MTHAILVPVLVALGAGGPDDLDQILSKIRAATGADRIAPHGEQVTIRSSTRDRGGFESTLLTTFSPDGRFFQRSRNHMERLTGFDGTTAWRVLWGVGSVLALGERESTLVGLWTRTGYWLHPEAPLVRELQPSEDGAGPVRIRMKLEGGFKPVIVEVDRTTWLPRSMIVTSQGSKTVIALRDYTDFDGWKLPLRTTVTRHGEVALRSVTESIERSRSGDPDLYEPRLGPPRDTVFDPEASPELEVKRTVLGDRLLVHPLVDGKDLGWFLLDTGAAGWMISRDVARKAGLELVGCSKGMGAAGIAQEIEIFRVSSIRLGPVTIENQVLRAVDFPGEHGDRVGLIGYGLLARCVMEYDDQGTSIRIHDPARFELKGASWQEMVPGQRVPTIETTFEGHRGLFRVDTGSNSHVIFNSPCVERLGLLEGRETRPLEALGGDGRHTVQRGTLDWIEIGGRRFSSIPAEFATLRRGVLADPYTAGIICNDLLAPFILVLDHPRDRIAFVPR